MYTGETRVQPVPGSNPPGDLGSASVQRRKIKHTTHINTEKEKKDQVR